MNSRSLLRLGMAAAMYILLVWAYLTLGSPQTFAAFVAFLMCAMLLYWVRQVRDECEKHPEIKSGKSSLFLKAHDYPSVAASHSQLDGLKSDLVRQYAEFGRDQSALNSKSLGHWHRDTRRHGNG